MKNIILLLFLGLSNVAFTQIITNTFPDTIFVGDTLRIGTRSFLYDNGSNPPLFCTDLLNYTDTVSSSKITFDKLYNYFGGAFRIACDDTLSFIGLNAGNYQLIGFWSRIRNFSSNSDTIVRYASDTIQVTVINSTRLSENLLEKISIHPSPTENFLYLTDVGGKSLTNLTIIDLNGQFIKRTEINESRIDVSDLSSGVYLLRITNKHNSKTLKFVKK